MPDDVLALYGATPKVLDVGCGPMSVLAPAGIALTAVDPLAEVYVGLFHRYRLAPPVWPEVGFVEDLSAFVARETFDVVYCKNALDHSFDPVRGLWEMMDVARVGGTVVLLHLPNEAEHLGYDVLHQWNCDIAHGDFILWNRTARHNVTKLLAPLCTVQCEPYDVPPRPRHILTRISKRQRVERTASDRDERVRELLTAFLAVALEVSAAAAPAGVPRPSTLGRLFRRIRAPRR